MNIRRFNIKISQAQVEGALRAHKKTIWPAVITGQTMADQNLPSMKDLTRKALNLPFEDLSFANFADSKVNATKLGIHIA